MDIIRRAKNSTFQNPIDMKRWLKATNRLYKQTEQFWGDFDVGKDSSSRIESLPRGETYPAFTKYPKFSVDYESQERKKIMAEEQKLLDKQNYLEQVRSRTIELETKEREQIRMQEQLVKLEEQNRKKYAELEKQRLEEMEKVEKLTRLRRLEKVDKLSRHTSNSIDFFK